MKASKSLAITIISFLVVIQITLAGLASANFVPTPSLRIDGPSIRRLIDGSEPYTLIVKVHVSMDAPAVVSISYSLDGGASITTNDIELSYWEHTSANLPNNHKIYSIERNFDDLSYGNHTLIVYSLDAEGHSMSETSKFVKADPNIPNSPSHSPSATPTTQNMPSDYWLNQTILISIVSLIAISPIAFVSIVYFSRRRKKPTKTSFSHNLRRLW